MKIRLLHLLIFLASIFGIRAAVPEVNVFVTAPEVSEGGTVQFVFRKEGTGSVFVPFQFGGTAVEGVNFKTGAHWIAMPESLTELRLMVYTLNDTSTNTSATLALQLQPDLTYSIGIADVAAARIVERVSGGTTNSPPSGSLTANQFPGQIDFQLRASDVHGIAAMWLLANGAVIATFTNLPNTIPAVTNFSWLNPPKGRYEMSAIAQDRRGLAASLSNSPPIVILVGDNLPFPPHGVSSTNGTTFTAELLTSFDNAQRHRRVLLEIPVPAAATNSESYFEFTAITPNSESRRTNELYTYTGDGILTTDDLFRTGAFVAKFVASRTNGFRFDVTSAVREHAGGYLGVWINAEPQSGDNPPLGATSTRFADFKLNILDDATDEPTTARWINPTAGPLARFQPVTFSFEVADPDSRITSAELHSNESGLLARFTPKGPSGLGTNTLSITWTNPSPGNHSLFLKISNEDGADATNELGQVDVPAIDATISIPAPPSASRPEQIPFPVEGIVVTPGPLTVTAELSVAGGAIVDTRVFDLVTGTNRISLIWTNPIVGDHVFQIRIIDQNKNSIAATSSTVRVENIEHEWLYTGDNIQSMHVVDAAGRARVWGYNFAGELGLGFMDDQPPYYIFTPTILEPPSGLTWKQIISSAPTIPGGKFHFGLASDGSLWGWGYNGGDIFRVSIQSVFRTIAPMKIPFPVGVEWWRKIVCNQYVVGGIDQNGDLVYWGRNTGTTRFAGPWLDVRVSNSGFIGLTFSNTLAFTSSRTPIVLPGGVKATREFSVCDTHGLVLGADGQLYGWGYNGDGLPMPESPYVFPPQRAVQVEGVESWRQVATTTNLSLAVDNHGRLFSWGSSPNTGARNPVKNKPALVDIPETGWLDVAVNPAFAMALSQAGNLYIWGDIRIDTNTVRRIAFPERVEGLPGLLDPNYSTKLATFDISSLSASAILDLMMIAPTNSPMQLEISNDLQTWRAATTIAGSSNRVSLLQRMNQSTNSFFRIRPVTAAAK